MSEVKPRSIYYPYIDGLRAIAVISVVLYHLKDSYLPGGFSGVDVFFVISGFVVSISMANFKGRNFFTFVTTFYARRMKRIRGLGSNGTESALKLGCPGGDLSPKRCH